MQSILKQAPLCTTALGSSQHVYLFSIHLKLQEHVADCIVCLVHLVVQVVADYNPATDNVNMLDVFIYPNPPASALPPPRIPVIVGVPPSPPPHSNIKEPLNGMLTLLIIVISLVIIICCGCLAFQYFLSGNGHRTHPGGFYLPQGELFSQWSMVVY